MLGPEEIEERTFAHPVTNVTGPLHQKVRFAIKDLMTILDQILPEGREKALAITNLEQAEMWANKAIARMAPVNSELAELPHSRACGFQAHAHGQYCHPNCPTCGGQENWNK